MSQHLPKSQIFFKIILLVMLLCVFCFTVGQFIPIYFTFHSFIIPYYFTLFAVTVITVTITSVHQLYSPQKKNRIGTTFYTVCIMSLSILIFGFITLTKILAVWVDRGTLYYQKNNPEVKIVSRYIDLGAGGGGTEPGDYKIVLKRPITPFFKLETSVDTNAIDKSDWIKEGYK